MLPLYLMLWVAYYAYYYAGIVGWSLERMGWGRGEEGKIRD